MQEAIDIVLKVFTEVDVNTSSDSVFRFKITLFRVSLYFSVAQCVYLG